MDFTADAASENIAVVPVVVMSATFPAGQSSIPGIGDFVRRCLTQSPLADDGNGAVGDTVAQALLETPSPADAISVSCRIFPGHVEVDVLRSGGQIGQPARVNALTSLASALRPDQAPAEPTFAGWLAGVLRREGLTMEAAARQLGVSVKTVSRWVGGTTEPRLRDLRRVRALFGDLPFP